MIKPNYILHSGILAAILILSIVRAIIWSTPNNKLHELGMGSVVVIDLTIGACFALGLAIISFLFRKQSPSKTMFYATQILTWLNSIGVWVGIIGMALYVAMHGGV